MVKYSRFELAEIQERHDKSTRDKFNYDIEDKYLSEKLAEIGLPPHVSRAELAERCEVLESELD